MDLSDYEILLSNYEDSTTKTKTLRPYESLILHK